MDDHSGGMGIGAFTIAAKPAPAAVGQLHGGQAFDAGPDHVCHLIFVKYRVVIIATPLCRSLLIVADFLSIEIGSLVLNGCQIDTHAP